MWLILNLAPLNVILVIPSQITIFLEPNAVMLEHSYTLMMKVVIVVLIFLRVVLHVQWMLHSPLYVINVIIKMDTMDIKTLEKYVAIPKMISIQITVVDVEHVSRCSKIVLNNHVYTVILTPCAIAVGE